jgi:hypothetical protein
MKLIQSSPRQLICEDDTHRQQLTLFSVQITFAVILIWLPIVSAVLPDVGVLGLAVILSGSVILCLSSLWAGFPEYTATIDLDYEYIEIKKYWPLLHKRSIRQYSIDQIKNVGVRGSDDHRYQVMWRQRDRTVVMFGGRYAVEQSQANADAEQIRSFLNQDGRDIEISFFRFPWYLYFQISSD